MAMTGASAARLAPVIDAHCHAGPGDGFTGPRDPRARLDRYLRRCDEAGIVRSNLFAAFHSDYTVANDAVGRIAARRPDRFYGFPLSTPSGTGAGSCPWCCERWPRSPFSGSRRTDTTLAPAARFVRRHDISGCRCSMAPWARSRSPSSWRQSTQTSTSSSSRIWAVSLPTRACSWRSPVCWQTNQHLHRHVCRSGGTLSAEGARAVLAVVKKAAAQTLPTLTAAFGADMKPAPWRGKSPVAAAARVYGLELEGLSAEDRDFEIARQLIRFAQAAASRAANPPTALPAAAAVSAAVESAAQQFAPPGLLPPGPAIQTGPWVRRERPSFCRTSTKGIPHV
jgi:hypothetical protein